MRATEKINFPVPFVSIIDVSSALAIDLDPYLRPLTCASFYQDITFFHKLRFWTMMPPFVAVVAFGAAVAAAARHNQKAGDSLAPRVVLACLSNGESPVALRIFGDYFVLLVSGPASKSRVAGRGGAVATA